MVRLFIAIDFTKEKDYLQKLQEGIIFPNARLTYVRAFHLTLKFLGEIQPNKVDEIISRLKNIEFKNFPVFLNAIGVFPSENYIRVVWISLKPEEKILELQSKIDESLKDLFKKEKGFKGHITLARVKYLDNKKGFVEKLNRIKVRHGNIDINRFILVKSTLTPQGPIYEDLAGFKSRRNI